MVVMDPTFINDILQTTYMMNEKTSFMKQTTMVICILLSGCLTTVSAGKQKPHYASLMLTNKQADSLNTLLSESRPISLKFYCTLNEVDNG